MRTVAFLLCFWVSLSVASADNLDDLARDFWTWRAVEQPFTLDDIPRIDRPADLVPDWSPATVERRRKDLAAFEERWRGIDPNSWPVPKQVDYRLMGSAIARVRWELEVERGWQRNPNFYVDQTLGPIFDRLLQPPPFSATRSAEILRRLESVPAMIESAKANLTEIRRPFASLAVDSLNDVRPRIEKSLELLKPHLAADIRPRLDGPAGRAISALESYRGWLADRMSGFREDTAVGHEAYVWFLRNVALIPFTPEQLLDLGAREFERSASFETYESNRNRNRPQLALFPDQAAQMSREEHDEAAVRRFLTDQHILTVPDWMQHYRNLPLPDYIHAFGEIGVTDDLTGPTRLKEDAVSYIRVPSLDLGYFGLSTARDPRPILVHEGIPGHYFQLALSWANEDPIRRHYYDSGANEGIGFYAEEMMLQAGFFDDSPRTREIIYNFMRLRALRVEVDVKLATGKFTLEQAGRYLERNVPMDSRTALGEAAMFASIPGQAITYQVGKAQIMRFLASARSKQKRGFDLQRFHDFVWKNGNVPIALQQWEYLDDPTDVPRLER